MRRAIQRAAFGFGLALALLGSSQRLAVAQLKVVASGELNDDQPVDDALPRRYQMLVTPAGQPRPALKYQLELDSRRRHAGNAVPYYYRALLLLQQIPVEKSKEYVQKEQTWLHCPLDQLPKSEVETWLQAYAASVNQLEEATIREHCDWDLRPEKLNGFDAVAFLLPEYQEMRTLARVLRVKVRLELARGDLDAAVDSLRMAYRMARDVGSCPFLVGSLVGTAIVGTMNEATIELIATPQSPNLFWAVASLPRPLINIRNAMETERRMPEQIFPWLADAEQRQRSTAEWQATYQESIKTLQGLAGTVQPEPEWFWLLAGTAFAVKNYPVAKRELVGQGFLAEQLESMPVGQVLAIYSARKVRYAYDELFKVGYLPYPQAMTAANRALESLKAEGLLTGDHLDPIVSVLLPAVGLVLKAQCRSERDLQSIMLLEALRMHAAEHHQWPETLDDISLVPVPINPATGRSFEYRREGNKAVLEVPPMMDEPPRTSGRRYIMELKLPSR